MNNPIHIPLSVTSLTGVQLTAESTVASFVLTFETGMETGLMKFGADGDWVACPSVACQIPFKNVDLSLLWFKVSSGTMVLNVGGWCGD